MHKGSNIPDDDRILRFIPKSKLFLDEDGNVIGVTPQAFELREEIGEESLSVHWVEFEGNDLEKAIQLFRKSRSAGPNSYFAAAYVKKVKDVSSSITSKIKIVWSPSPSNPAHSSIKHIPDDPIFASLMADEAFDVLIKNSDIPAN